MGFDNCRRCRCARIDYPCAQSSPRRELASGVRVGSADSERDRDGYQSGDGVLGRRSGKDWRNYLPSEVIVAGRREQSALRCSSHQPALKTAYRSIALIVSAPFGIGGRNRIASWMSGASSVRSSTCVMRARDNPKRRARSATVKHGLEVMGLGEEASDPWHAAGRGLLGARRGGGHAVEVLLLHNALPRGALVARQAHLELQRAGRARVALRSAAMRSSALFAPSSSPPLPIITLPPSCPCACRRARSPRA